MPRSGIALNELLEPMLAEATGVGSLKPACIDRPIEANHSIHAALGTDGCLVLVVSVTPLVDGIWRVLTKAVVAGRNITG